MKGQVRILGPPTLWNRPNPWHAFFRIVFGFRHGGRLCRLSPLRATTEKIMLQLIYHSLAVPGLSSDDLHEIIEISRRKNFDKGISGILVFNGSAFLQVLEGPQEAVTDLMGYIDRDPRHTEVRTLMEHLVPAREFGEWAMVLAEPHDQDILGDFKEFTVEASVAHQVLSMFHTGMLERAPADRGEGSFTLSINSGSNPTRMLSAASQQDYLITLGRALALSMPETSVDVRVKGSSDVTFNKKGNLKTGDIELF